VPTNGITQSPKFTKAQHPHARHIALCIFTGEISDCLIGSLLIAQWQHLVNVMRTLWILIAKQIHQDVHAELNSCTQGDDGAA